MDKILRLNEFFVEGGKQQVSHVLLHITEPSTPEEMHKGNFFAICEINNAETKYITRIQELIDQAENDYYEIKDTEEKTSLELVLEKLNQEALTLVSSGIELHCLVGAIRQPELMFAYYGKPHVYIFYRNPQGMYQSMNLVENGQEGSDQPTQLFSHIMQGKISQNDFLFAGTPHIGEYFSADRLQKIITSRPAVQSSQHIQRVLSELKNGFSFGGLIMHIDRADAGPVPIRKAPVVKGASSKSLHSLFNREQSTANTLSPSLFPRLNERLRELLKLEPSENSQPTPVATETVKPYQTSTEINAAHVSHRQNSTPSQVKDPVASHIRNGLGGFGKALVTVAKILGYSSLFVYSIVYNILRNGALLFFVATNYQNRRNHILETWRKEWHSYKENIRQLPILTKILFLTALLVVAGVTGSVATMRYRQAQAAEEEVFQNTIRQIRNKKDAMESALIYKDDEAAFAELTSAQKLLSELPCDDEKRKSTCADLSVQLEELTGRIKKITIIQPELIHAWQTSATIDNLIKVNTKLIGFSSNTSTIFVYDLLSREEQTLANTLRVSGFTKSSVPKENDYIIIGAGTKEFFKLDPISLTIEAITVSFPSETTAISDFSIYNRRLYTLDTINNQIYRHDSIKNGFAQGTGWIKDGTLVKDGQELTIDGDMFVLKNNGDMLLFTSGINQPFSITGLDPAISTNTSLWTYTDQNYLYVTDPTNKRIIILDKKGRTKEQLISPTFTKPYGLAVEENTAFVVDNNQLLKINLPQ